MEPVRLRGGLQRVSAGLLTAALLWHAAHACGQTIKIPDFRDPPRATVNPGEPCDRCGAIIAIRQVQTTRPTPVPQVLQTNPTDQGFGTTVLVGAVVILPLGRGADKPYVGGVGTPEMRARLSETTYEVVIRFDNEGYTTIQRADGASFRVGDRVRVRGTELELLAP